MSLLTTDTLPDSSLSPKPLRARLCQALVPMRSLLAFLFLLLLSSGAAAKCGAKFYVFSGSVEDANGVPLPDALVGVSWIEASVPRGPAMTRTDEQGNYSVPIRLGTFSGHSLFGVDRCKGRVGLVSVMAYTSTHRSQPELIDIGKSHQVTVPPLRVEYGIDVKPVWPDEAEG